MATTEQTPLVRAQGAADPAQEFVKTASIEIRLGFVRKVYGILCAQLILTFLIAAPFQMMTEIQVEENTWIANLASVGMMIGSVCMVCCKSALNKFPTNYIFLFMFTAATSVFVGYISALYSWQTVLLAVGLTLGIFLALTLYAWTTTTDFTGLGPYLFVVLFAIIIFGFTLFIMGVCGVYIEWMYMLYNFIGVLLFSFFIVYDTQLMLGEWGGHEKQFDVDDYCFAAINIYLDIINLFLFLLSLLGDR